MMITPPSSFGSITAALEDEGVSLLARAHSSTSLLAMAERRVGESDASGGRKVLPFSPHLSFPFSNLGGLTQRPVHRVCVRVFVCVTVRLNAAA